MQICRAVRIAARSALPVLAVRSAHIEGVESEFIVTSPHSCQGDPHTIAEVRRILLEHLAEFDSAHPQAARMSRAIIQANPGGRDDDGIPLARDGTRARRLLWLSGCAMEMKKQEEAAKGMPVNCDTAEADIRMLQSEKAHVAQQVAMGVTAIVPASLVHGLLTGTEGTKVRVATGEYNAALDKKIAEIKTTCGLP